jgi:hypothetical protein
MQMAHPFFIELRLYLSFAFPRAAHGRRAMTAIDESKRDCGSQK